MTKSWSLVPVLALCACSGHAISTSPGTPASAELHVAPSFTPVRATQIDPVAASIAFVHGQRPTLGLDAHATFTTLRREITADGNDHVRLQQAYDGVKVWGSDVVVHSDGESVTGVDGTLLGALRGLDLAPSLADTTATTFAKNDYVKSARDAAAVRFAGESSELVVLPLEDGSVHLAWHVVFATDGNAGAAGIWNYFVDAHDGAIVQMFNNLQTAVVEASGPGGNARVTRTWSMNLDVTQSGTSYTMKTPQFETKNSKTGADYTGTSLTAYNSTDPGGNDGHGFAEVTIKMLKDWQGYNSIDNAGLVLVSNIHAGSQLGTENNAAWDGSSMNYGDGDGTTFFQFTGALDVIAHEIDHGFTQYHANLTYSGQSGGMNESFSDIAGTTAKFYYDAKSADFNLGGDIFVKANTYIRWMCTPSMDGKSIDTASAYKSGLDVHYSSGVMNRAFCRSSKRLSGVDPDTGSATVDGVKKASKAFYEANASHWTSSTQWTAGCQGVVDAATALHYTPGDISGLGDSWKDVGVTCNYTHVNDFGLTLTPATATAMAGTSSTFMVATTAAGGNTPQSVALTITGLPTGVTGTFAPASLMTGATSTLTIATPYDAALGDIKLTVTATGTTTHTAAGTLTVTAPPPDMTQPPPPDMADGTGTGGNGGNGGSGGGSGDHGGSSGCSMSGASHTSPSVMLLIALVVLLLLRRGFLRR